MSLEHDREGQEPDYLVSKFPADDVVTGAGYEQPLTPYHSPVIRREKEVEEPEPVQVSQSDQELLRMAEDDEETRPTPVVPTDSRPAWLDEKKASTHPPHSVATASAYDK